MSDYRWQAVEDARPTLVDAFSADGVSRVEYVAAFPDQQPFAVWLGTATDSEAQRLRASPTVHGQVHDVLQTCGFQGHDLTELKVVIQSQETVDRDYAGNWFYALR